MFMRRLSPCFPLVVGFLSLHCLADNCRELLKSISPNTEERWIDTDTKQCTKQKCRLDYISCLGAEGFPAPYGPTNGPPRTEDMVLVFSDEFTSKWRDFRPGKDAKWQALDLLYVNDDQAMFRSDAVKIKNGRAVITATRERSSGPFSALWGDQLAYASYKSGMLQGWNKFCFTGGYLEARVKLPGDDEHGGLWPAVFTLGNLGRAGYLRSTDGVWPFSYDTCDAAAVQKLNYSDHYGQRINRCNSTKGRGAPEIDLLEVGVWQSNKPQLSTSLQVAPVLPQGLHWLDPPGGVYFPTYSDPTLYSGPNGWAGVLSYMSNDKFRPRPGSRLADSMSATHSLNASHFTDFYVYGFDWAPGKYIRWYINDKLVYEINSAALVGGSNGANESVGDRLIPVEPQYININLAMSNSFAQIVDDLPLPASMEIDYVRVFQARSEINTGCDTPDFPSQDYIDQHVAAYKVTLAGFEDFVGNSHVMGPTAEAPPPDPKVIVPAVLCPLLGRYLIGLAVGYWLYRRWQKAMAARAAEQAAGGPTAPPVRVLQPEEEAGQRRWWVRWYLALWHGSPAAHTRHALAPKKLPAGPAKVKVAPIPVRQVAVLS